MIRLPVKSGWTGHLPERDTPILMTPEDKAAIKVRILEKMNRTKADIADLEALTQPIAPENSIGRISRMDAINNKAVNEATLRTARNTLGRLEKAMIRLEEPFFGTCVKCGEPIQILRLKFMPESTHCMKCAR